MQERTSRRYADFRPYLLSFDKADMNNNVRDTESITIGWIDLASSTADRSTVTLIKIRDKVKKQ